METCKHLRDSECWATSIPTTPTQEICRGCTSLGRGINDITVMHSINTLLGQGEEVPPYLYQYIQKTRIGLSRQEIIGRGPGTRLKNILSWFVTKPPNCACNDRAELMNLWGPAGCEENFSTILGWLRESALDTGHPYNELIVTALVRLVIRLSK